MRCQRCGYEVEGNWRFCPKCGSLLRRERDPFSQAFRRMEHELKEMDRSFEREFEVLDISPFFRKPVRGGGFSVKISSTGDEKPKVTVRTFGDVDRKNVENRIGRLGLKKAEANEKRGNGKLKMLKAKRTEEPETSVRNVEGCILVEVKLPEVRDPKDIQLKSLENSIEVRAIAGDKAYFKILKKPERAKVLKRHFENGILTIELA